MHSIATFSIVATDGASWGVAVASKFLAVGWVVPWARAGSGAVATQALANASYGPEGIELLRQGLDSDTVLTKLVNADEHSAHRQVGIVDGHGQSASWTGSECHPWAGGVAGPGFAIQGNILAGPEVVLAMRDAWLESGGEPFSLRMMACLEAGDEAGGDSRGRQSAALLVAREGGGFGGATDRAIDLRVDDHQLPIVELARLLGMYRELFTPPA